MAGRIRTIKPELLEDAKTARLSDAAWRLFVSGILLADDFGVLRAESGLLVGAVFWGHPTPNIEALIDELAKVGLWVVYTVSGQQYAQICSWSRHQRVDRPNKNRRLPQIREADAKDRGGLAKDRGGLATDHDHDHDRDHDRDHDHVATSRPKGPPDGSGNGAGRARAGRARATRDPPGEALDLASQLSGLVVANNPDGRHAKNKRGQSASIRRWADSIRLLHSEDGQSWQRIHEVLEWSQRDEFWRAVILSGQNLRKQWDKLCGGMARSKSRSTARRPDGLTAEQIVQHAFDLERDGQ